MSLIKYVYREELEKQRAWAHYNKMHAEGKTEEARADLARLAIIKKQREEAAKKREIEKQGYYFCCSYQLLLLKSNFK